jgi:hypothetical protein
MKGRRIPAVTGANPASMIKEPGDYYGPVVGWTGDKAAVFFFLPLIRDVDGHPEARAMHHVVSPPHKFKEEYDGSLTIRESIGAGPSGHYYWHGYLTRGNWEKIED